MLRDLDQLQQQAFDNLRQRIGAGARRLMLQAPTGYGKTVLAGGVVYSALKKEKRVLVTVPAIVLVDQTVESFWKDGIADVGVMQGQHERTDGSARVQVASVQTLMRRKVPQVDLVLVDEAHRWFQFYAKWFLDPAWANIPFIGLSATPWTKGLGAYWRDGLIVGGTIEQLIGTGRLSPFRVFAPSHPDLSKARTVAGDYHPEDASEAMQTGKLTADIVTTWQTKGEGRPTFLFAVDRAHAKALQQQFSLANVPTAYIDAYTKDDERKRVKRLFHTGEIKIVCNVGVLTTGVDWDVRCIILARPTKSEMLFVQMIGRGLRSAPGKDYCLILDHSYTHLTLGFVTDIHHEEMDDGVKKPKEKTDKIPLPKECPQCHGLRPPRVNKCPHCGFVAEVVDHTKSNEGELAELKQSQKGNLKRFPDKALTFGMLRYHCKVQGKKEGWASHKFKEMYGVWPNHYKDAQAVPPSDEILSWIRSQNIRWAKSRKNTANQSAA